MQTFSRIRDQRDPRSFAARKGHLPQLSISDDNHHVTEVLGHLYDDDESPSSPQSPARHSIRSDRSLDGEPDMVGRRKSLPRKPLPEPPVRDGMSPLSDARPKPPNHFQNVWDERNGGSPVSPLSVRDATSSDTATAQFPLNDIDYESSPAAVAQELSNLQALRRMSMDLGSTGDPDLPPLNAAAMPLAPSPTTSEDDSARLFWVPASLHPELAPKEFKSFLESKAEQIKRRSGELSAFSSPGTSRSSSLSVDDGSLGLRRKKSTLSKQINNSAGYQDGADLLEQKRSEEQNGHQSDPNLQELEAFMSGSSGRASLDSKPEEGAEDMILPSIPGSSLKRSTRTKYQRPSSRKGPPDQGSYAERARRRAAAGGSVDNLVSPTADTVPGDTLSAFSTDVSNLALTLKDPTSDVHRATTNFSRPGNRSPSPPSIEASSPPSNSVLPANDAERMNESSVQKRPRRVPNIQTIKAVTDRPIPQIVEPPPTDDHPVRTSSMAPPPSNVYSPKAEASKSSEPNPARDQRGKPGSSPRPSMPSKQSSTVLSGARPSSRAPSNMPPQTTPSQTLDQPSPLPGQDTNTSNLSFIPTLTVDKRQEQRKKEEKKSGWSWLLGKEESEREKEKSKSKGSKAPQAHDSTRLDVLQTSIDGGVKGRDSLVLDRESLKLEEERKKESQRKTSGTEKKEKESLFSSIFGGKRHKAEKEAYKKSQERLSPEPPYRELKPDIDYNWTRFSILEERTIYRMAHIKLANPRRALYSQVLLSNFMYSYLAKVQQMHPQMNLPTSAKQQRKQKEQQQMQQQQQQQQPEEFAQYQRYQQQQAQQEPSSQDSTEYQASRSGFEGDSHTYDFNYSREKPQSDLRGDQHSMDSNSSPAMGNQHYSGGNGNSFPMDSGNSPHYHQQPQQWPQHHHHHHHHQQSPGHKYEDDDDDDDDMW